VWLGLLIVDFTSGLNPLLQTVSNVIWALFILDFAIEILIAPDKLRYLRRNWLTAISLMLPALRILRIFRALRVLQTVRAARTVGLLRLVTSVNRGMRATAQTLGRRGLGYVIALTLIVIFAGAAGMQAFENPQALRQAGQIEAAEAGQGLNSYGDAVWWTAMLVTTIGGEYWPKTAEGRILTWVLSLYTFAVFVYITAALASYFVGSDRSQAKEATSSVQEELAALRQQVARLVERSKGER
jgi:voltage-gated potassium channel